MPPSGQVPSNPAGAPPPAKPLKAHHKHIKIVKIIAIFALVLLFGASVTAAYIYGKRGERVIVRAPSPPPITLPPQAIVAAECVPGLGKQYVLPKDIPNGPIYDVKNSKVIAVEYNYKAVDLFINPNRLSNTIIPLTKNYQIDHFTTTIGELKGGTSADAQQVPIHLIIYVASKAEADAITCPK